MLFDKGARGGSEPGAWDGSEPGAWDAPPLNRLAVMEKVLPLDIFAMLL